MKNLYDADYYEAGIESGKSCYTNYRWIPELTIPLAHHIANALPIKSGETILDYGCAKGYLVYAFRLLHYEAFGYDISEYAIASAHENIKKYLFSSPISASYDWVISKDVFEHIPYDELEDILNQLRRHCRKILCIIPLGQDGKYVVPAYELDTTHIIREPLGWWAQQFESAGFVVQQKAYHMKYVKESWVKWEKGNGFFILESRK